MKDDTLLSNGLAHSFALGKFDHVDGLRQPPGMNQAEHQPHPPEVNLPELLLTHCEAPARFRLANHPLKMIPCIISDDHIITSKSKAHFAGNHRQRAVDFKARLADRVGVEILIGHHHVDWPQGRACLGLRRQVQRGVVASTLGVSTPRR